MQRENDEYGCADKLTCFSDDKRGEKSGNTEHSPLRNNVYGFLVKYPAHLFIFQQGKPNT